MNVFLVPVAPERYELYCEEPDDPAPADLPHTPPGAIRRMMLRFRQLLAEAEHERRRGSDPEAPRRSLAARVKARVMRWVAESIAEQRLLWQLRGRAAATLVHPDDLSDHQAGQLLKRSLQRDWERHRFWLIIDALGCIGCVLLIILPGPNLLGYYFLFRVVGHYLSLRGARQGLVKVTWTYTPSHALTTLRGVVGASPESRESVVREVASTLQLEHLASFFQRAAVQ
jgi:Mitochondrial K+-H+ exchange-related